MRHLREVMKRTRASLVRILGGLNGRMKALENRLAVLESDDAMSIHYLELKEHNRNHDEKVRLRGLNDGEFRLDLEKQYGTTKWATRLIDKIIDQRVPVHSISFAIAD